MSIKIYIRPHCKWSAQLQTWLTEKNYDFETFDLTQESHWRDEHIEKSGQLGTPVIDIEGKILIGFNKKELQETLAH